MDKNLILIIQFLIGSFGPFGDISYVKKGELIFNKKKIEWGEKILHSHEGRKSKAYYGYLFIDKDDKTHWLSLQTKYVFTVSKVLILGGNLWIFSTGPYEKKHYQKVLILDQNLKTIKTLDGVDLPISYEVKKNGKLIVKGLMEPMEETPKQVEIEYDYFGICVKKISEKKKS